MDGGPPPPLTPEQLALLPHDDRGPALVATTWCLTVLASIFLVLRVYCKMQLGVGRGLWWDDWILIAAWVVLLIDAALATHLVNYYTYGRHSWDFRPPNNDIDGFFLAVQVRATFTITAIAWTKTAFAITLLRLTEGWVKKLLWFVIISVNIALGFSALFGWIRCTEPLAKSWTPTMREGNCWLDYQAIENYSIFSGAWSGAADFLLALLPWTLLAGLQMKRQEKIGVGIAMSMGFIAGIAAIFKTVNLPKLATGDLYDGVELVIWDITEAAVSMVAACIPVLRVLVREVRNTTRGSSTAARYYADGAGSHSHSRSGTHNKSHNRDNHQPSWLPGWTKAGGGKANNNVPATSTVVYVGGGGKRNGLTSSSRDSVGGSREDIEIGDNWSEMNVLVGAAPAGADGDQKQQNGSNGHLGIVRIQEVTVESRRQSVVSTQPPREPVRR